jgi:hypothetical protein
MKLIDYDGLLAALKNAKQSPGAMDLVIFELESGKYDAATEPSPAPPAPEPPPSE